MAIARAAAKKTLETKPTERELLTQLLRNQLTAFVNLRCFEKDSLAQHRTDERILETRKLLGKDDIT